MVTIIKTNLEKLENKTNNKKTDNKADNKADNKTNNEKTDDVSNVTKEKKKKSKPKLKQKTVKEIKVEKAKRNALQRLFSKNKSRYKNVLTPEAKSAQRDQMRKYLKGGGSKSDQIYKDMMAEHNETFYKVKKKGLFNDKTMTAAEVDKLIKKNQLVRKGKSDKVTGDYYSPLEMNSREKALRKRSSNPNSHTPFAYKERVGDDTPFYQVKETKFQNSEVKQGGKLPEVEVKGENVFDLMEKYGDLNVKSHVDSIELIGDEKPPQLLGSSAVEAVTNFMNTQKEYLFNVRTGAGYNSTREGNAVIANAKSLAVNLNKIGGWMAENIESISNGEESKGSSVASTYLRDILITQKTDEQGLPLTTMLVDNKNDLAIKFRDIEGAYNLKSIKENIFPKSFKTFETISTAMKTTMDEAMAGMPFNEQGSKALINNALKTQEEILSSIHDEESPLYRILEDFAEAYPNANMDFFHIDSPYFSLEDLKPIVKDYALKKLRSQHALYSKGESGINQLTAEQIIKKFSSIK